MMSMQVVLGGTGMSHWQLEVIREAGYLTGLSNCQTWTSGGLLGVFLLRKLCTLPSILNVAEAQSKLKFLVGYRKSITRQRPREYRVMLHNDDFNRREYVVKVLLKVIDNFTMEDAINCMQVSILLWCLQGLKNAELVISHESCKSANPAWQSKHFHV